MLHWPSKKQQALSRRRGLFQHFYWLVQHTHTTYHTVPTAEHEPCLFPHSQPPGKGSSPYHWDVLTAPLPWRKAWPVYTWPLYSTHTHTHTHTHTRCQHTQMPEDSRMGIRWQKRLIAINVHSSVRTSVKWTLWLKASSKSQPRPERDTAGRGGENEMGQAPLSQAWHQKSHAEERPVGSAVLGRWMGSPH